MKIDDWALAIGIILEKVNGSEIDVFCTTLGTLHYFKQKSRLRMVVNG